MAITTTTPRVLLVAPEVDGMPFAEQEIQQVMNLLPARRLLFGTVTLAQLVDELQRSKIDIFWYAGHSSVDGLCLSDGVLTASRLVQLLRRHEPQLVFLNSCESFIAAMDLHEQLRCAVIGTILPAPDDDAFVTGVQLAGALASGMGVHDAYAVSRPGSNRQYVLLNGDKSVGQGTSGIAGQRSSESAEAGVRKLPVTVDEFEEMELRTVRMLNQLLIQWGQRIEQRIDQVERRVDERIDQVRQEMGDRFDAMDGRYQVSLTGPRSYAWVSAFGLFAGAGVLFIKEVRDLLGVPWWTALLGVLFLYGASLVLFVYGLGLRTGR
jgi:hypothetical protein